MYAMKKTFVGNVCLVVFTAFLLTIILGSAGMVGGGRAEASPTAGTTPTFSTVGTQQQVEVQISPVTQATWDNIVFDLLFQDSGQGKITQIAGTVVYGGVYTGTAGAVYHSVYNNILSLRYLAPSNVTIPTTSTVVYQNIYEDSVARKIYVTLIFRPPEVSSPGTGVTAPAVPVTVDHALGQVTTDQAANQATVTIVPTKILAEIASTASTEIKINFTGTAAKMATRKVDLPADTVAKIAEAAKNLVVSTGEVSFVIPPGTVSQEALKGAGAGARVELSARNVTGSEAGEAQKAIEEARMAVPAVAGALAAASNIINLSLAVKKADSTVAQPLAFGKRIEVSVNYNQAKLSASQAPKAGLYRFVTADPKTGQKLDKPFWQYVRRSKVDPVTGKAVAKLKHFSLYSVMLFDRSFPDMASHWAKNDVELMASRHVVTGRTGGGYDPEASVTRAEFAAMIQRTLDLDDLAAPKLAFSDVPAGAWYAGAVAAAANAGIVKGLGDGSFRPDAKITRQEMAVMMTRALELEGKVKVAKRGELTDSLMAKYSDRAQIADWAFEASAAMVKDGLLKGRSDDRFAPAANATRAEGATMIKRVMGSLGDL